MKTKLLSLLLIATLGTAAQNPIPNPGFETWSTGNPTGWTTNNIQGFMTPILQSNSAHSGNSAVRLEVVNAFSTTVPPALYLTNPASVSQDFQACSFYYKGNLNSGDGLLASISVENNGNPIGSGIMILQIPSNTNIYTQTVIPITYSGSNATDLDLMFIISSSTSTAAVVGSYVIIDDISLSASVGLDENRELNSLSLGQVYPNPISDISLIPFSLSKSSSVNIELYAVDGKKVMNVLQTELNAGNYKAELDASQIGPGVYLCKLQAEGTTLFTKVVVK